MPHYLLFLKNHFIDVSSHDQDFFSSVYPKNIISEIKLNLYA